MLRQAQHEGNRRLINAIGLMLSLSKDEYARALHPSPHPLFRFTKAVIMRRGSSLR